MLTMKISRAVMDTEPMRIATDWVRVPAGRKSLRCRLLHRTVSHDHLSQYHRPKK